VTTSVIILEPWKGPGYTRQNTRFTVETREEPEARVIHPIVVEDTVSEPWEEGEYQPKVLEDKCRDQFDIPQPISQGRKPCQSSFSLDFEDMASPYGGGGGERDVQRFSGAAGTIEVDDFKREFTMWCELQKSHNTNFHPYWCGGLCLVVWRVLYWQIMGSLKLLTSLRSWHGGTITPQIMQMYLEEPLGWWINPIQAGVKRRKKRANLKKQSRSQGMW
jgi:hypothetical protein